MKKTPRTTDDKPGAGAGADARAGHDGEAGNRRAAPRLAAALVPAIAGVRLASASGETEATLVNISTSGVLVECGCSVRVGDVVTVLFEGTFAPAAAPGRAVRTAVSRIGQDGTLRYQVGLAFLAPIALPDPVAAEGDAGGSPPGPPAAPAGREPRNRW